MGGKKRHGMCVETQGSTFTEGLIKAKEVCGKQR